MVIVGSGIAGLFAALEANKNGQKVAILTKSNPFRSSSAVASGGINAVIYTGEDSIQQHIQDTIKGADGLVHYKNVEQMCYGAAEIIEELESIGVHFDKTDEGKIAQRPFGGTKKKRTCHVADTTGSAIIQKLLIACRDAGVHILANHFFLNITYYKNQISGVTVLRRRDTMVIAIACKAVIFAGGGYAGIYRGHTTNAADSSGDSIAAALRAGLELSNMEFVQFHPTTLAKSGSLISEAARGEGGYIIDENGTRFTDELLTRDRLSREVVKHMRKGHQVFLDLRHLDPDLIAKKLPSVKKIAYQAGGLDIQKEIIEIAPSAHYTIGGIATRYDTSTDIHGVFACGECATSGVHGANRLGGNSLLEGAYFGKLAGFEAAKFATNKEYLMIDYAQVSKEMDQVERIMSGENRYNINTMRKNLGHTLFYKAGVFKSEEELLDALDYIHYLMSKSYGLCTINKERENNVELVAILEFDNALLVAEAMVLSALKRQESRGVHFRSDHPFRDDKNFDGASYVSMMHKNLMKVNFKNAAPNHLWHKVTKLLSVN